MPMTTMRAAVLDHAPGALTIEEIPIPEPLEVNNTHGLSIDHLHSTI